MIPNLHPLGSNFPVQDDRHGACRLDVSSKADRLTSSLYHTIKSLLSSCTNASRGMTCYCTQQNGPAAVMLATVASGLCCFWGLDFVHQNVSMIHMTAVLLSRAKSCPDN